MSAQHSRTVEEPNARAHVEAQRQRATDGHSAAIAIAPGDTNELSIRYTINPNKLSDFKAYVEAEQEPIRRSGGSSVEYFLPTDFAGPTSEALGLIDFGTLADYERYRSALANDLDRKANVTTA